MTSFTTDLQGNPGKEREERRPGHEGKTEMDEEKKKGVI